MLGRKVMISSATIPPALAEGFFNAYQAGWCLHQQFMDASPQINCAWVDEFSTVIKPIASAVDDTPRKDYEQHHLSVISKRAEELKKQPIKRKGVITQCNELYESGDENQDKGSSGQQQQYFAHMQSAALALHEQHHMVDEATGKKVSFGVMRVANIPPCVALTQYLMQSDWPENFAPKIMAYHSRQVLLLRSVQEHHLDTVLKRKEPKGDTPKVFENAVIRQHLDHAAQENVLFILVATPVEEVGRDHDFDWAVIEPSSYRSIIQLAGRVRRHRTWAVEQPNIAVMQYNLKALRQNSQPAFTRPGYENKSTLKLDTHNMCELINESALNERIDALPRMIEPHPIRAKSQLADLEHQAMNNALKSYDKKGPEYLQGWINECWWMTALPQAFNRFRESSPDIQLYRIWQHGEYTFSEKDDKGIVLKNIFGDVAQQHNRFNVVDAPVMNKQERSRLWLKRDYEHALREECGYGKADDLNEKEKGLMCKKSQRYGEVRMPENESACWYSDDLGLWPKES
jgi:CRISPR-associated endonuclease/helicase Cas3